MDTNIKISVCIPTYEAKGKGVFFLEKNLNGILAQTYSNFEIIISDHSVNDEIERYVTSLNNYRIKYFRYKDYIGKPAYNTNNAINNSTGDYIKIMNQDDYIESNDFFEKSIELLNGGYRWVLANFKHLDYTNNRFFRPITPSLIGDGRHLLDGINTVGCPSVGLIPKGEFIDENVTYMIDCDLWYRMFVKYGPPGFIKDEYPIVIGAGSHNLTEQLKNEMNSMMERDKEYCKNKYNT